MPWYKNEKPSILGLSHKGDPGASPQMVQPGEVFEADAADIPEAWKTAGFITDAKAPPKGEPPKAEAVPDVASEAAPTDKEVQDADKTREKSGLFGSKHAK